MYLQPLSLYLSECRGGITEFRGMAVRHDGGEQSGRRVPGSIHFLDEADFPFPTFCGDFSAGMELYSLRKLNKKKPNMTQVELTSLPFFSHLPAHVFLLIIQHEYHSRVIAASFESCCNAASKPRSRSRSRTSPSAGNW